MHRCSAANATVFARNAKKDTLYPPNVTFANHKTAVVLYAEASVRELHWRSLMVVAELCMVFHPARVPVRYHRETDCLQADSLQDEVFVAR